MLLTYSRELCSGDTQSCLILSSCWPCSCVLQKGSVLSTQLLGPRRSEVWTLRDHLPPCHRIACQTTEQVSQSLASNATLMSSINFKHNRVCLSLTRFLICKREFKLDLQRFLHQSTLFITVTTAAQPNAEKRCWSIRRAGAVLSVSTFCKLLPFTSGL